MALGVTFRNVSMNCCIIMRECASTFIKERALLFSRTKLYLVSSYIQHLQVGFDLFEEQSINSTVGMEAHEGCPVNIYPNNMYLGR